MFEKFKSPMEKYLDALLDAADPQGQAAVVLQFNVSPVAASGALRRHKDISGLFEFMTIIQGADPQGRPVGQPQPVTQTFEANAVAAVIVIGKTEDLPRIVAPPTVGGVQVPH